MKTLISETMVGFKQIATGGRFWVMILLLLLASLGTLKVFDNMVVKQIPIAVLDFDNSKLSRTLKTYLSSTPQLKVVAKGFETVEDAKELFYRGEITAIVLITNDFSSRLKKGQKGFIVVASDMSNILLGKMAHKSIAKVAATLSAGVQMTLVSKLGERKERKLSRVVPISIEESFNFNPATNYMNYLGPGLIFFYLHVFIIIMTSSFLIPPLRPKTAVGIAGRQIAVFVILIALGLLFFYGFLTMANVPIRSGFETVFVMLLFFIISAMMMTLALGAAIPKPLLAMQAAIVIGMLSMMFSGITWPTDMFPRPLQIVAQYIPYTPFAKGMRIFLHYPADLSDLRHINILFAKQIGLFSALSLFGWGIRKLFTTRRNRGAHA